MHLVGYLYEDYHDARSLEHKKKLLKVSSSIRPVPPRKEGSRYKLLRPGSPEGARDPNMLYTFYSFLAISDIIS